MQISGAYNNIGDAGVDAWDYCRCIRLFAFGYICGYISYDEYLIHAAPLAVYLQNEYDSWETMYESYYYGYLIFAGRNKNSSSSVIYSDYRYYEIMADKTDEMYENASMHQEDGAWQMIFGVNTLPAYRNHGYAGELLKRAIADAKDQGRKGLVLTCKDRLVHYYAKFGFENEGVSESVHGNIVWNQMRLKF